jgi:hypothetical protein
MITTKRGVALALLFSLLLSWRLALVEEDVAKVEAHLM